MNDKPFIFISYSRKDDHWMQQIKSHLAVIDAEVWYDKRTIPGSAYIPAITDAINRADIAVCIVSPDYLASDAVRDSELPLLKLRRERDELVVVPVLLLAAPLNASAHPWLNELERFPPDGSTLLTTRLDKEIPSEKLCELSDTIAGICKKRARVREEVNLERLPSTRVELFGRARDIERLNSAWEERNINCITLFAWGGVGKTTLLRHWLEQLLARPSRRGSRIFVWSFYTQQKGESIAGTDIFLTEAKRYFNCDDPQLRSPWDLGHRLAQEIRRKRTLLVLDGFERVQSQLPFERGKVVDPALETLLQELASDNPGLVVITSRYIIPELDSQQDQVQNWNLETMNPDTGRSLLRYYSIAGSSDELDAAIKDFGGNALALQLLVAFLEQNPRFGSHVNNRADIESALDFSEEQGRHPRRILRAFERLWKEGPKLNLLRLLSLFEGPVTNTALTFLHSRTPIPSITEHLVRVPLERIAEILDRLYHWHLVERLRHGEDFQYSVHPIIREHFADDLRERHRSAWQEAHQAIYEYFKTTGEPNPSSLEDMAPWFSAVAHGCEGGLYRQALHEVYIPKIQRGEAFYCANTLGAVSTLLAMLRKFFRDPWLEIEEGLTQSDKTIIFGEAGYYLRALGNLKDAVELSRSALAGSYTQASITAGHLSHLFVLNGNLDLAFGYAEECAELGRRSGDQYRIIASKTAPAYVLYQQGRSEEAKQLFVEAEVAKKHFTKDRPYLESVQGFQYGELLLHQGYFAEVAERARCLLRWRPRPHPLLDEALGHLLLGSAQCQECSAQELPAAKTISAAKSNLTWAVKQLRDARQYMYVPQAMLALANLFRIARDYDEAEKSLADAMSIAVTCDMMLYKADLLIERAHLVFSRGDRINAVDLVNQASELCRKIGFGRNTAKINELQENIRNA